jgi:hypothetical protein
MTHIVVHPAPGAVPISPQELLPWTVFVGLLLLMALYFVGAEQGAWKASHAMGYRTPDCVHN